MSVDGVDYINASWIDLPTVKDRLVITAGPLLSHPDLLPNVPDTRSNFWTMVWELKSTLIVMLCDVDPGYRGCAEYFPREGNHRTMTVGAFRVR